MIYVLLGKIRQTCFLVPMTVVLLYFHSFTNNGWSLWLFENTWPQWFLWVIYLMSSCVICLVIAGEIFLLLSDCSVITKVHNFSLSSLLYKLIHVIKLFCKGWTNTKNWGLFIQIGYFFSTWMSVLTADFLTNRLYYWFAKHLHHFCCWCEWLEAQFQILC